MTSLSRHHSGVSAMVATVMLVAITVVLAGVLYFLIVGLGTGSTDPRPVAVEFASLGPPGVSIGGYVWENFSLTTSQTLTTAEFGFGLAGSGGLFIPPGNGTCVLTPTSCHLSTGWMAFLYNAQNTVLDLWNSSGWNSGTVTLAPYIVLCFLASPTLHVINSGDVLKVVSKAQPTVIGQSEPF